MSQRVHLIIILALFDFNFDGATSNDEINEDAYPSYEYSQIFQSIPAVFEYLLNTVEEKPEILENNEAPTTKRTIEEDLINEANDEGFENPSNEENCVGNEKLYEENRDIDSTKSKNIEVNKYEGTHKLRDTSTAAYEYGNSILTSKEDTCEMKTTKEVIRNENVVLSKDKKVTQIKRKRNADKNKGSYYNPYLGLDGGWEKAYVHPGFQSLFSLDVTIEEIEQGIIMTEKLLEEYNNNRLAMAKGNK